MKLVKDNEIVVEEERQDIVDIDIKESASQATTSTKSVESKKKITSDNSPVYKVVEDYTQEQINSAIEEKPFDEKKNSALFKGLLLGALLIIINEDGQMQYKEGKDRLDKAGYDTTSTSAFYTPENLQRAYSEYLNKVSLSYTEDTSKAIKNVLEQASVERYYEHEQMAY